MNKYLIITGGTLTDRFIQSYISDYNIDKIICVDGALSAADRLGISIDYLVGDYDTVPKELIDQYKRKAQTGEIKTQILTYNPVKDATDTQIAVSLAVEKGAEQLHIVGATGTRIDHLLANIHLLMAPMSANIPAFITDANNRIYLKDKSFTVYKDKLYGSYFSLIPFEGSIKRVTLTGFKYNTNQVDFTFGSSLGVSNELILDKGEVSFSEGIFIVIESRD